MTDRVITGTVRLDNRDELLTALSVHAEDRPRVSDLDLARLAYERWAGACTEKLLGDFAFVIRDRGTGSVFGARDPLGVVPFYYRIAAGSLAFALRASAVAAVDGLPLELDEGRLADVLVPELECIDATCTLFRGVTRLPAGHRLSFDAGRLVVSRYWSPESASECRPGTEEESVDAFRSVFTEAVRCRLSSSTASMLSGGLDSSAIAGFAGAILRAEGRGPLATLSAVTDDPGCEETRHVRAVLGLPGFDPVTIGSGDLDRHLRVIDEFVASAEEPFDGTMIIPLLLYRAAKDRGFDAVLDGVDGDAVASREPDVLASLLREGDWGRAVREARGFAAFYEGTYAPWSSAPKLLASHAIRAFTPAALRDALRPLRRARASRLAEAGSILNPEFASKIDLSGRLRTLWSSDSSAVSHPRIGAALERYFRVAASQGIVPRHPFLDRRVVELCLSLPWDRLVRDGWSKWIVRRATEGFLPDPVRWRRGRWTRLGPRFLRAVIDGSGELLDRELSGTLEALEPYTDLAKVRAVYADYRRGDPDAAETGFRLAVLSSWLRKFAATGYDGGARANGPVALPCLPVAG